METLSKHELAIIIRDSLIWCLSGNGLATNNIEKIVGEIMDKTKEPKVRKTYLSEHAPDGVTLAVTADSIEEARKCIN